MKRGAIIFLSIFLMSVVSAVPTLIFQDENIQPGETIIATIETPGNFERQIEPYDIKFYEGRKPVSFEFDIKFYEGIHYLYIYTTREDNFSIEISEILYKEADELAATTITKQFNITTETIIDKETNETMTEILQIKPGFIFTTETPTIKLINKGTETLDVEYGKEEISLASFETKEITIIPEEVFSYLDISTYKDFSIPIIYPSADAIFVSPSVKPSLRQDPDIILVELLSGTKLEETFELFNFGNDTLTEIQIVSDFDFIEVEEIADIAPKEVRNVTLEFDPKEPGHFEGNINITYTQVEDQNTLLIPLDLFILPKGANATIFEIVEETCEGASGTICEEGERCYGEMIGSTDPGYCCSGTCAADEEEESEGGGYGWLIGLIIIVAIAGGVYYLYKKQKAIVPKKPEEQMKESSDKYAKRLAGSLDSKRVTGSVTKS